MATLSTQNFFNFEIVTKLFELPKCKTYSKVWEMATLSAFLLGREVAKPMVERGRGSLIITGRILDFGFRM